jgi:hypothetical protein
MSGVHIRKQYDDYGRILAEAKIKADWAWSRRSPWAVEIADPMPGSVIGF